MATKLYYNQDEIIFISIFFLFLLGTFIFLLSFPAEKRIDYETQQIMEHLSSAKQKNNSPIKKSTAVRKQTSSNNMNEFPGPANSGSTKKL